MLKNLQHKVHIYLVIYKCVYQGKRFIHPTLNIGDVQWFSSDKLCFFFLSKMCVFEKLTNSVNFIVLCKNLPNFRYHKIEKKNPWWWCLSMLHLAWPNTMAQSITCTMGMNFLAMMGLMPIHSILIQKKGKLNWSGFFKTYVESNWR